MTPRNNHNSPYTRGLGRSTACCTVAGTSETQGIPHRIKPHTLQQNIEESLLHGCCRLLQVGFCRVARGVPGSLAYRAGKPAEVVKHG